MKKFQFRLDRVLQYRQLVKDEKSKELIVLRNILIEEQEKLKALEAAYFNTSIEEASSAEELQMVAFYLDGLKNDIECQKKVIQSATEKVLAAQAVYLQAAQEEKTLSQLKERNYLEYQEYLAKEEAKNIDEVTVQMFDYIKDK